MRLVSQLFDPKTPDATVRVGFKLAAFVAPDTIVTFDWSAKPADLTFSAPSLEDSATTVASDVAGGVDGTTYAVACKVTMASGLVLQPFGVMAVQSPGGVTI